MTKGLAIVCVTNNLVTDQRADKHCKMLVKFGYNVVLVGRNWPQEVLMERPYKTKRFKLLANKGALFYALYNIRLFLYLINQKSSVVLANDLDTLPAAYLASLFKKFKLVFDSHEYFSGVPEIQNKALIKCVWKSFENLIIPKLNYCLTVNQSIQQLYEKRFNKNFKVVRNVPFFEGFPNSIETRKQLNLDEDAFYIILQGAGININRGAEELILSLKFLDEKIKLLIIGSGDVWDRLRNLVLENNLHTRVKLIHKLPYSKMLQYTYQSNLGVSLDKPGNPNYDNSLPNKVFDYLYCGIPVLVSNLKELNKLINTYQVGLTIDKIEPESIANAIHYLYFNHTFYNNCKRNAGRIRYEISWETEYESIKNWF